MNSVAVLEYFLDAEAKEIVLGDFIFFFNEEYNAFTEILLNQQ